MNEVLGAFNHPFMMRALIVGMIIALCASLIGVTLVPRRSSMIGDGLSHAAFGAFATAIALGFAPIPFVLPIVVVVSFLILHLTKSRQTYGDAMIAVVSAMGLAIGTIAVSVGDGVNVDLNSYLFGSILSLGWSDVAMSIVLLVFVIGFYVFLHHRIFAITFDDEFAAAIGIKVRVYDIIFALICSCVVVIGMQLLGALLISSLIILPALSAMQITKSFKSTVVFAILVSLFSFLVGMILSYIYMIPTGATVVVANFVVFVIMLCVRYLKLASK